MPERISGKTIRAVSFVAGAMVLVVPGCTATRSLWQHEELRSAPPADVVVLQLGGRGESTVLGLDGATVAQADDPNRPALVHLEPGEHIVTYLQQVEEERWRVRGVRHPAPLVQALAQQGYLLEALLLASVGGVYDPPNNWEKSRQVGFEVRTTKLEFHGGRSYTRQDIARMLAEHPEDAAATRQVTYVPVEPPVEIPRGTSRTELIERFGEPVKSQSYSGDEFKLEDGVLVHVGYDDLVRVSAVTWTRRALGHARRLVGDRE